MLRLSTYLEVFSDFTIKNYISTKDKPFVYRNLKTVKHIMALM